MAPQAFADRTPYAEMGMRPNASSGNPGRSYRFLDTTALPPLWSFGHGLSYTQFGVAFAQAPSGPVSPGAPTSWVVEVTNRGGRAGDVVLVCYVAAEKQAAVAEPPRRALFDFMRVEALAPAASRFVSFTLTPRGRALATPAGEWVTPPGAYSVECEAGGVSTTGKAALVVAA